MQKNKHLELNWVETFETAAFVLDARGAVIKHNDHFDRFNATFDFFRFQDKSFFTLNKIISNKWYENLGLCMAQGASRFVVKAGFVECVMSLIRAKGQEAVLVQLFESKGDNDSLSEMMIDEFKNAQVLGLTEMTASLAHEINNPLAVISARAQILQSHLRNNPDLEKISIDLHKISHHADKIKNLVSGMSVFSKNLVSTNELSCSLRQLILDAQVFVAREIKKNNIDVVCNINDEESFLTCKPPELIHVFSNLFANSVYALSGVSNGRIIIDILEDGEFYHIFFSDNGPGVPPALDIQIFKPFFSTKPSGSGLGLSLSHKILQSYDGRIRLARERGASCFQISLKKTLAKSDSARKIS